jgi:hypothetical protein
MGVREEAGLKRGWDVMRARRPVAGRCSQDCPLEDGCGGFRSFGGFADITAAAVRLRRACAALWMTIRKVRCCAAVEFQTVSFDLYYKPQQVQSFVFML